MGGGGGGERARKKKGFPPLFPGFPSRCVTNSDPCPVYLGAGAYLPIPSRLPPQEEEKTREKRGGVGVKLLWWWLLRLLADLRAQRRNPGPWRGRAVREPGEGVSRVAVAVSPPHQARCSFPSCPRPLAHLWARCARGFSGIFYAHTWVGTPDSSGNKVMRYVVKKARLVYYTVDVAIFA
jgi:hypothetical protein